MENKNIEPLEETEAIEKIEETDIDDKEIQARKKPRTEKQIEAFKKVLEKRNENRKARAEEREKIAEEEKVVLEEKIMKKAVSIKKKQIKKQIVLDDISDDDEPMEEIKQKIVKSKKIVPLPLATPPTPSPQPQRPIIYFV